MGNASEGTLRRRYTEPAKWLIGRPKKGRVSGRTAMESEATTQMKPGVKYHPKTTQNGHMERGNPPRLSQVKPEQATRPQALAE